jgi:hypothetical protein
MVVLHDIEDKTMHELRDMIEMVDLVKDMEVPKRHTWQYNKQLCLVIDYSHIDFGHSKHRESFLDLDFIWGEVSCSDSPMSDQQAKIYTILKPALTLLGLRHSSVHAKQLQLE